jgi:transposase
MTLEKLPDDVAQLKTLVLENYQRAQDYRDKLKSEEQRAELYKFRCETLTRKLYGPSSEKSHEQPGQQLLFELPTAPEPEPAAEIPAAEEEPSKKRSSGGRRKLPPELRRERRVYELPESERKCSCCNEPMQPFGEETSEQLEYIPASVFVIEHVRIKYACKACQEKPAVAPPPDKVIDKGLAAAGLLSWIAVSKFGDHQPLYRQENILERHGVNIPRSTQCAWMGQVAELLEPLWKRMAAQVKESTKIHTDDTPIDVLDPGRGKTRTARFWVYVGDGTHPVTVFDYTPSRKRIGPQEFLKGFKGYLQADAYGGYDQIYAGPDVTEVACWAHTRRKFFEAQEANPRALEMVLLIAELYAVEARVRPQIAAALVLPAGEREAAVERAYSTRLQMRQTLTVPIMERIETWLEEREHDTLPKSPLGLAMQYARNQWKALNQFTKDGALEIDNNIAENALRPIALGRKNYLFMGSDEGGRRAAILYTLIRTCERHGVNAWAYLKDVLERISTHPASEIDALLPQNWTPAKQN